MTTKTTAEMWTAMGRRWGCLQGVTKPTLYHLWRDADGKERVYSTCLSEGYTAKGNRRKGSSNIGGRYNVQVDRADGACTVIGDASWSGKGWGGTEDERAEWRALDLVAEAHNTRKRQEAKARKGDAIADALAPIRAAMLKTNTLGRRTILAEVLRQLGGIR